MSIFNTKRMTGMTEKTVEHFVLGAGVFAKDFIPGTDTYESAKTAGKLLGATTGGGEFKAAKVGHYSQVDGAPENTKVIPLCATMKVKEEELFGAMATLTGVTGGTAEVSTQLKATIQGFMQPTTAMTSALKKMGYENGQAAIESLGLQGALDALKESVNGDELAFAGMFSSVEAKTAVLALAGAQSEDFTNKTKEMYSATGAAESAFDTQTANLRPRATPI